MRTLFAVLFCFISYVGASAQIIQLGSDIDGESGGDLSGTSIAMSDDGHIIAVGATKNDGNGSSSGHVRVHRFDGNSWSQLGSDIDGESNNDESGRSVALNKYGNILAIGANLNQGSQFGFSKGHVRVYQFDGTSWIKIGSDINGESNGDWSGWSVSLSDDGYTVAIGAVLNGGGGQNSGHVRVYRYNGNNWYKVGADINGQSANSYSGTSVSLSSNGNRVAIGAPGGGFGSPPGSATVFELDSTSTWVRMGSTIYGGPTQEAGTSVSLSNDGLTVAIGAPDLYSTGRSAGYARVYHFNGSSWQKVGSDIVGETLDDGFGTSVALSGSGNTIVVGALDNDGNGTSSGHARLYEFNGTAWTQVGSDFDGEAPGDNFGTSVAISNDGDMIAIGGINNDDGGANSGHVRVFGLLNPVARILANPNPVNCKQSVVFNAALSYHLDTSKFIQSFEWDVDDDGTIDNTDTSFTHVFNTTGTYTVELKVIDNLGQIDSNTIEITVIDTAKAFPDSVFLDTLRAECSITPVAPTATDSCAGKITGTPDATFPITAQDTTVVTWTYDDGSGNTITQQQIIIIDDTTAPVLSGSSLPNINAVCEVLQSSVPVPVATDACEGTITASTKTIFPVTDTSVKFIKWTFDDGNGNIDTLSQNINWTPIDISVDTLGFTITANKSGVAYQWLNCDSSYAPIINETSRSFIVTQNGSYAVEITEGNCVDTSDCVTMVIIGINEIEPLKNVSVFPNPSSGTINLDLSNVKKANIRLYNLFGQLLYLKENIVADKHQFNVELESGVYIIEVLAGSAKKQFKITILDR